MLVYDGDTVARVDDPALPAADESNATPATPEECAAATAGAAASAAEPRAGAGTVDGPMARAAAMSVGKALSRAYRRNHIDREAYSAYKDVYSDAKRAWRRLSGSRRSELGSVITTVNALAARGQLSASRMSAAFLELQRNTEWWTGNAKVPRVPRDPNAPKPRKRRKTACTTAGRIAAAGQRIQFAGDPLTLQHYPGSGLRLQPLANFGKANAMYSACKGINTREGTPCEPEKLRALLDRLIDTAANRSGFVAWEYYFWFGGGRPPWVSGIATGSALSALARGATLFRELEEQERLRQQQGPPPEPAPAPTPQPTGGVLPPPPSAKSSQDTEPHDSAYYLDVARRALPVYRHAHPVGIRAGGQRGDHYLIYSFSPGLRVGNAFLESLIGLWDYWTASGDRSARALWIRGDRQAKWELPRYDTGAWSVYSLGGAESDLDYHRVIRDFAQGLCERTKDDAYCVRAQRFDRYLYQPAKVAIAGPNVTRVKRPTRISIRTDKITCITVQILRGDKVVHEPTWYFPRGTHSFTWTPPRTGTYRIHLLSRDLMSRRSHDDANLRVLSRR